MQVNFSLGIEVLFPSVRAKSPYNDILTNVRQCISTSVLLKTWAHLHVNITSLKAKDQIYFNHDSLLKNLLVRAIGDVHMDRSHFALLSAKYFHSQVPRMPPPSRAAAGT